MRTWGAPRSTRTSATSALAEHVAETFLRVLTWWVEREVTCRPEEADARFLALVRPVLAARFGA